MEHSKKLDRNNIEDILALSAMQEGILFYYLKNAGSLQYFEQLSVVLSGYINIELIKKAWNHLKDCNEVLRTVFRWEETERPVQIILKNYDLPIRVFDFSGTDESIKTEAVKKVKEDDRNEKIDISISPLRITICVISKDRCELIISNNHIIFDGWSSGILLKEFFDAYFRLCDGRSLEFRPKNKYKEFIKFCQRQNKEAYNHFWKDYLSGFDTPTMISQSLKGSLNDLDAKNELGVYSYKLEEDLFKKLSQFTRENDITLSAIIYFAWGLVLQIYTNTRDVVFGTTVSGRPSEIKGINEMVGLFINTLPLRVNTKDDKTVIEYLGDVNRSLIERESYECAPLTEIKQCCDFENKGEIFDSLLVIENYPLDKQLGSDKGRLFIGGYSMREMTNYPLTLEILNFDSIKLVFQYDRKVFEEDIIKRLCRYFVNITESIIMNPRSELRETILLPKEERESIERFNLTKALFPKDKLLFELFEEQAEKTPHNIALVHEEKELTYSEFNKKANQMANYLRKRGAGKDSIIGIMAERSIELIVGIFAILKAGGAYLPIDPGLPRERICFMLNDSKAKILLTQKRFMGKADFSGEIINMEDEFYYTGDPVNLPKISKPDDLAYIIFTSGSTGNPKGVMIEHNSAVNILTALQSRYPLMETDSYLFKTTYTFDVSVAEIFGWFFSGGKLVILKKDREKDPRAILKEIERTGVTHINFVPSMFNVFLDSIDKGDIKILNALKYIFVAGEAIPASTVRKFYGLTKKARLENIYGPTESTIYATAYPLDQLKDEISVPIGKPLENLKAYIMGPFHNLQPIGAPGELCLAGQGLARGYLNRPELTEEKFPKALWESSERIYKTGDLAVYRPDANIAYLGRMDSQVKIRGFRVELGEIEAKLLGIKSISEAVVITKEESDGSKYLCAYIATDRETDISEIKNILSKSLPNYMIPPYIIRMDKLPLTRSGKIDRKSLPKPKDEKSAVTVLINPSNEVEGKILSIWREILGKRDFGIKDNFFDIGGTSLQIIRVQSKLKKMLGKEVPIVDLFEYPSISLLAKHLLNEKEESVTLKEKSDDENKELSTNVLNKSNDIAVIGMAGRFPGAKGIKELWENIANGVESIRFFSDEEMIEEGVDSRQLESPNYVKAKGILQDIDMFDADFFGFSPREAEVTDPQQRVFLECSWEALENAGYDPETYEGSVGVYAGVSMNTYLLNIFKDKNLVESIGDYPILLGNDKDFLSTRVSYKLNLRGPSVSVQTACSTSLAAVHQGCRALISGECQMALAGGASIRVPHKVGYIYQPGGINSPDGHCRAFDAKAKGTVGGNGIGVVVLKRLSDALNDHDYIYAVIKGSALNNDGSMKVGYTAPSVEGQSRVISKAHVAAGVRPDTISYVETHGTGTELGDPIEIAALNKAFAIDKGKKNYCAIGSLKTNIGHLDAAAGVAGLMKTALSLKYKMIPPSLNFELLNPKIDFINSPFYVNTVATEWNVGETPRRAGVSSFGIGGTNAHVVLEEAPLTELAGKSKCWQLLLLSGKTEEALKTMSSNLAEHLKNEADVNIADAAYTLQVGRASMKNRKAIVCRTADEAADYINNPDIHHVFIGKCEKQNKPVTFIFPGQDTADIKRAFDLYEEGLTFKSYVDKCLKILNQYEHIDIREFIYPTGEKRTEKDKLLKQAYIPRLALFIIEYSMAKMFIELGIVPKTMIGQDIGEYVAACIAGVLSLEDALKLVIQRCRLMQGLPHGKDEFKEAVKGIHFSMPQIPYYSNVTGAFISSSEVTGTEYWEKQLCQSVHFKDSISKLLENQDSVYLGIGPENALGTMLGEVKGKENGICFISAMNNSDNIENDMAFLMGTLGKLWVEGAKINWKVLYKEEQRRRIPLPTYPFDRKRYWIEPQNVENQSIVEKAGLRKNKNIEEWFYTPIWKQSFSLPTDCFRKLSENKQCWMLLMDDTNLGGNLNRLLESANQQVVLVYKGKKFEKSGNCTFIINPCNKQDYQTLVDELAGSQITLQKIVHLWGITKEEKELLDYNEEYLSCYDENNYAVFYSLVYLMQAIEERRLNNPFGIHIVTNYMQKVVCERTIYPEKAMALGLSKVISQEYTNVTCQSIDIDDLWMNGESFLGETFAERLVSEFVNGSEDKVVAYRDNSRWVQGFEKFPQYSFKNSQAVLKDNGVYLITGGLGGIGLTIAETISKSVKANIILIGKSQFPERNRWESIVRSNEYEDEKIKNKISILLEIEKHAFSLKIFKADVSNLLEMESVIGALKETYGKVDGIIHAAGRAGGGMIQQMSRDYSEKVIKPKIIGTRILNQLLKNEQPDFFLLCSSLNSLTGGFGQADYCAANAFLDLFAAYNTYFRNKPTLAIDWDTWNGIGMASKVSLSGKLGELWKENLEDSITPQEGAKVFEYALNSYPLPRIVVSTRELGSWISYNNDFYKGLNDISEETKENLNYQKPIHQRPRLATPFASPRSTMEEKLARIWERILGIERIGINDNFFELGGNSLIGVQLVSELKKEFNLDIPLVSLYEGPNVSSIGALIGSNGLKNSELVDSRLERGQKRRNRFSTVKKHSNFKGDESVH